MFSSKNVLAAAFLVLASLTTAFPIVERAETCVQGVVVIAARGSDPNWHQGNVTNPNYAQLGAMKPISDAIIKYVGKGSYLVPVPYPASIDDYFTSLTLGYQYVQGKVKNYTDQCKSKVTPRIVLLGYSQGAQVMSLSLVGGSNGYGNVAALPSAYIKSIVGGTIFADPSFQLGYEPLNGGSDKNMSGIFNMGTTLASTLNKTYSPVLRSYCQYGDYYCSKGITDQAMAIHGQAVQTYTNAAETFLNAVLKKYT